MAPHDTCLVCYERPATTGAYQRVICDECYSRRTGRGQESEPRVVDCGSCGEEGISSYYLMRCDACGDSMCESCPGEKQLCVGCDGRRNAESFDAEGRKVRTMSGKPHTPRKLRKDQNIKPEEARMRKQMKAEEYFDCGCVYEEMAEGAMCESCGHTTCIDCSQNINTTDANYKNWRCYEGYGCNKDAEGFEAESTPFAEGRMAARAMFTPERTPEDYYSGLDTEYMITYDISPDELMEEVESNRTRYLQFLAGWDDGWNYSSLVVNNVIEDEDDFPYDYLYEDLDLTTDYEFAGEYYHYKDRRGIDFPDVFDEYLPDLSETMRGVATIIGVGAVAWLGMMAIEKIRKE